MLILAIQLGAIPSITKGVSRLTFEELAKEAAGARQSDHLEDAISLYHRALVLRPSWDEGWWYLADILYRQDRFSEARDALAKFLSLEPRSARGWALQGLCNFELHDYDRALKYFKRARLLGIDDPDLSAECTYREAVVLARFGMFEAGSALLLDLVHGGSDTLNTIEALGIASLQLPFLPSELPQDKRDLVLRAGQAVYDLASNRKPTAQQEYEDLLSRYPETPGVHYAFGMFLLASSPDDAVREFQRELKISPNHVAARLQIAFEYMKRSEYSSALPFAQEALDLVPNSPVALFALGRVHLGLGKISQAIPELEAAMKMLPDSPEIHYTLAAAYTNAGRKEDAARQTAEFLRLKNPPRD